MDKHVFEILKQLAAGICLSSGGACEVAIHDMSRPSLSDSVIFIENGELTGRKVGDGMLRPVMEALKNKQGPIDDVLQYEFAAEDGKELSCTLVCVHDAKGYLQAVLSINRLV